ncbi:MAG: fumarylacetoacetate hydrolase family protein [Halobacteriales archaeon]
MRRVRFRDPAGAVRQGEWTDDGIAFAGQTYTESEVEILPPVDPTKIVCLAGNYVEHAGEEVPDRPSLFLKGPNAVAGHGDTITLPAGKDRVDYEAEVGVVIGEQCRHVPEEAALDVVAGYTNLNDVSNRDDQNREQNWIRGKAFDGSAPIGPVVATPEHVDDPENPRVRLWQNGELKQDSADDELIFPVSETIAEVTALLTLEPGDVLAMGTSGHPEPMEDGDQIEIEIDGVGRLQHGVERA